MILNYIYIYSNTHHYLLFLSISGLKVANISLIALIRDFDPRLCCTYKNNYFTLLQTKICPSYQLSSKAVNVELKVVLRTNEDFTRISYILIYQQSMTIHLKLPKSTFKNRLLCL